MMKIALVYHVLLLAASGCARYTTCSNGSVQRPGLQPTEWARWRLSDKEADMLSKHERADPRATRTRMWLVQAFEQLVEQQDFADVTVQAIAAQASVNRATFYAHFTDKSSMMDEVFRERFHQLLAQRMPAPPPTAEDLTQGMFLALADGWRCIPRRCNHVYLRHAAEFEAKLELIMRDEVDAWLTRQPGFRTMPADQRGVAAALAAGAIYGAAAQWRSGGIATPPDPAAHMASTAVATLLAALRPAVPEPARP
ncbi:TetR/AcrR family transcriptional regulator [Chloroflexia bacterium SDU3-3]|nr:TetR/AcrR family transcriptional regulator [Chloroflexia bacterium SDU3-3]